MLKAFPMSYHLAIGSLGKMELLIIAVLALIIMVPCLIGMGFLLWHLAKARTQREPTPPPPLPKQPPEE